MYLLPVQGPHVGRAAPIGLSDHYAGELNLHCEVGHLHGIVIIIGDLQGVLGENEEGM